MARRKRRWGGERGLTLVEAMIAVAIGSIVITFGGINLRRIWSTNLLLSAQDNIRGQMVGLRKRVLVDYSKRDRGWVAAGAGSPGVQLGYAGCTSGCDSIFMMKWLPPYANHNTDYGILYTNVCRGAGPALAGVTLPALCHACPAGQAPYVHYSPVVNVAPYPAVSLVEQAVGAGGELRQDTGNSNDRTLGAMVGIELCSSVTFMNLGIGEPGHVDFTARTTYISQTSPLTFKTLDEPFSVSFDDTFTGKTVGGQEQAEFLK